MKNTFRTILGICLCFMMINNINASTKYKYVDAINKASQYVYENLNYKNTYERYIYPITTNVEKFYEGYTGVTPQYGGMLSYDEFEKTKNGRSNNSYSYLYDTTSYWTYSGSSSNKRKLVADIPIEIDGINNNAHVYNARVTEIVKSNVSVIGTGTFLDPWIFEQQYNVTLRTNDITKGKLKKTLSSISEEAITLTMSSNQPGEVFLEPKAGYEYLGNTCGIIVNDIDVRNELSNNTFNGNTALNISMVTRDIECTVNFGEKPYTINLKPTDTQYSSMTDPNPKQIYVIKDKSWYKDATSTIAVSNIQTNPTLEGYTFEGYYTQTNYKISGGIGNFQHNKCEGIEIIDKNGKLGSTSLKKSDNKTSIYTDNMTLHPCFNPITYTVKYNCGNGGTPTNPTVTTTHIYNKGGLLQKGSTICSKPGYTFAGWARDLNGTTPDRFYDNVEYKEITPNGEVTLYAQWTPNTYKITYYLGKGTTTAGTQKIGEQTCTYDANCTLKDLSSMTTFPQSNNGWQIHGWTTTEKQLPSNPGQGISYTNNQTFIYKTAENINLYAIGKRTINYNGGYLPKTVYTTAIQYWNPYQANDNYLTAIKVPSAQSINTWSFVGYKIDDTSSSSNIIIQSSSVNGTYKLPYNKSQNIRALYQRTLTISYNANGGNGTTNSHTGVQYYNTGYANNGVNNGGNESQVSFILKTSGYTRTGYTFTNWTEGSTSGIGYNANATYNFKPLANSTTISKTMYAKWSTQNYKINYVLNGGVNPTGTVSSYNVETNTFNLPTPTKEDYTFLGWYTESSFTNKVTQITKGSTGEKTFYAKWELICSLPVFTYTGKYELVKDDDTQIATGTNSKVTIPSSYSTYKGTWKIRFLTSGTLTFHKLGSAVDGIDTFLVGGGGNGGGTFYQQAGRHGYSAAGGGGGGGYNTLQKGVSVSLSTSYSLVIGASSSQTKAFGYTANGGGAGENPKKSDYDISGGAGTATGGLGGYNAASGKNGGDGVCEFRDCSLYNKKYGGGGGGGHAHNGKNTADKGYPIGIANPGAGGAGGGGTGNNQFRGGNTHNGQANTGGGGGGGSFVFDVYDACGTKSDSKCNCWSSDGCFGVSRTTAYPAGKGGSGIVIIRNKR